MLTQFGNDLPMKIQAWHPGRESPRRRRPDRVYLISIFILAAAEFPSWEPRPAGENQETNIRRIAYKKNHLKEIAGRRII